MNTCLPSSEELEKLTLRALVVYTARSARRVCAMFRGIIADEILDEELRLLDSVSTTLIISGLDQTSMISASERVVAAYRAAPADMKSVARNQLLFSLVQAALSACYAIEAAADPKNARLQMERAARAAQRAVSPIESLSISVANEAIEAARRDYDSLLRKYGEHNEVVIGDPLDHSEVV